MRHFSLKPKSEAKSALRPHKGDVERKVSHPSSDPLKSNAADKRVSPSKWLVSAALSCFSILQEGGGSPGARHVSANPLKQLNSKQNQRNWTAKWYQMVVSMRLRCAILGWI